MIPVKVLAVRYLANAAPALCRQLGAPEGYPSLGLLTTDCDDATYIALDAAGVPYLAHTVSSVGSFLAKEAGVRLGSALAYLIAPPLEGMYAMDAALKAADVTLCKLYTPPSETNFGGGLLSGTQSACDAACGAFADAVAEIAASPVER